MWKLTLNGTTKTFAEWRVQNVTLRRQNLTGDLLTFSAPRAGFADSPLLNYGEPAILLRTTGDTDVVWFRGTSQTTPEAGDAASHQQTFTIASPWRWLAENVFQQPWYNGTIYTSHIITVGTVGNNIKAVLDYAIAQSPGLLQYLPADLTALAAFPPLNEFTEKTCDQVIREQLQFAPDTVVWFDYETTPPTLRLQQRGSLPAVSLRMAGHDDDSMEKVAVAQLLARPDLQIPSAKINFEVIEEVDGQQFLIPSTDIYPPDATGREDGAFNATLTIQGRTIQNVFGELECAQIDYTSLDWWKLHVPALADTRLTVIAGPQSINAVDVDGQPTNPLPRELLEGQIAPWMEIDGVPIEWKRVTIKAKFAVQYDKAGETLRVEDEKEFTIELMTTDAPDGISSYSAVASVDSGDPVPTGLAQYLYTSLAELHYQAAFTLLQSQCDAVVDLGNVINLFGARTAHETMRALVQEVEFSIDTGTTRIQCGPPAHLGLSDLLALLQRFRVRRRWTNPDTQDTGELGGGGGDLALGKATANNASSPGESTPQVFAAFYAPTLTKVSLDALTTEMRVTTGDGTRYAKVGLNEVRAVEPTKTAYLSTAELSLTQTAGGSIVAALADAQGKAIRLREVNVCVNVNGVDTTKKILVLASEAY